MIEFPQGMPGFDRERRFTLVEQPELAPILRLQSLDSPELCLWAAPVSAIDGNYSLEMTEEDLRTLGLDSGCQPQVGAEVLCLAILCATENGPLTANLLAPVVINLNTRAAVQAVRMDRRYSHKHPIGTEAAC